jgi:hypothetical protein
MRFIRVLPDGGELETKGDLVDVGDRRIPETVIYRHSGNAKRPGIEVTIEMWDGVPSVAKVVHTARRHDGVRIRTKDINLGPGLSLDRLIAGWLAEVAYRPEPAPPGRRRSSKGWPVSADERRHVMREVEQAQIRRRLTIGQLRQVAKTYNAAEPPKHEDVAKAFGVSDRTAQRYIEKARAAGLLPPSERSDQ